MSTRVAVREKIKKLFVLDPDLDAFIMDYFDDVWRSLSRGMSRTEKINLLLSKKEVTEIENALAPSETVAALTPERALPQNAEESARLRQEISRLQQIIRDLELQLSGQKWETSLNSQDGLERVQRALKDIECFSVPQTLVPESQWISWGHNALDALESSLGKYHNIACDFRYRFRINKEPMSEDYRALLTAAEAILKQEVEEISRSVQRGRWR